MHSVLFASGMGHKAQSYLKNNVLYAYFVFNTYFTVLNVSNDHMTHPWFALWQEALALELSSLLPCQLSDDEVCNLLRHSAMYFNGVDHESVQLAFTRSMIAQVNVAI